MWVLLGIVLVVILIKFVFKLFTSPIAAHARFGVLLVGSLAFVALILSWHELRACKSLGV